MTVAHIPPATICTCGHTARHHANSAVPISKGREQAIEYGGWCAVNNGVIGKGWRKCPCAKFEAARE